MEHKRMKHSYSKLNLSFKKGQTFVGYRWNDDIKILKMVPKSADRVCLTIYTSKDCKLKWKDAVWYSDGYTIIVVSPDTKFHIYISPHEDPFIAYQIKVQEQILSSGDEYVTVDTDGYLL